ncbi:MAG: NADP-dependent isocitrate dehydrogenase [Candidatus Marinimicrobia bacterium]|nr:NADP-dependent isocitrate dehydrogenase [Candidatus Neomarinimicrobiota bacterium]
MSDTKKITIARGDGIGPEIMDATLKILDVARVPIDYDEIEIGKPVYEKGIKSGIPADAWDIIRKNKVLLKAPITTPQGGGYKSLNVTLRKTLNLYANVRQSKSYAPYVNSLHPGMNVVIIRENEEDLYAGIEHVQTNEVAQILKLITKPGTERIVRYAFEYAKAYGRRKVTCMTKDNIMKLTDGLFHEIFSEIAEEYPDIESNHRIIDIGAAQLAAQPERFDVVVTLNLYGDVLSDIAAQIAGSVGLAGSANIGPDVAMFEAVHGSAPDIAGKGVANPSGLLVAATNMLVHLNLVEYAQQIKNAWLATLEAGIHPADIYREGLSKDEVGTKAFADAVIDHLGEEPKKLQPVHYKQSNFDLKIDPIQKKEKVLVGVDVFIDWDESDRDPEVIGKGLEAENGEGLALKMITNRGVKVYPEGQPETFATDHWRCRFTATDEAVSFQQVLSLLNRLDNAKFDVIKTEHLYTFGGERGFSLGQGE